MPSFDALAGASLTPGGVQSGVNDLVAALVNGPIKRRQIEMQQAQIAQQNDFQNKQFGEQVASRLDRGSQHTGVLNETVRHNKAEEGIQAETAGTKANSPAGLTARDKLARERASLRTGLTPDGYKRITTKKASPTPTDNNPFATTIFDAGTADTAATEQERQAFRSAYQEEYDKLNASGGVSDITDSLDPSASTNPGASMPHPGIAHTPTPARPARMGSVDDLIPGGPAPITQAPAAPMGPPAPNPTAQAAQAIPAAAPGAPAAKTVSRAKLQAMKDAKFGKPTPLTDADIAAYSKAGFQVVD